MVKNGIIFGAQRYKCKVCGYQFTKIAPAGKPILIKLISHALYFSGLSMREVAPIVGVTAQSVSRWMKKWHPAYLKEVGDKSQIYTASSVDLIKKLDLKDNDKLLVVSTRLPSGAVFHSVVQLPMDNEKSLKE